MIPRPQHTRLRRRALRVALLSGWGLLAPTPALRAQGLAPTAPSAETPAPAANAIPPTASASTPPAATAPAAETPADDEPPISEPAAMTAAARAHYERGLAAFAARDFAGAIRAFELGFAVDARREFLFAEAQAYRLAGDCGRAVPLYDRFLASAPAPIQIEATRLALDRCRRLPPTPAAPRGTTAPTTPPPVAAAERPRWWRDPWAATALGAGVVALGIGVGFAVASDRARDEAESPSTTSYPAFARRWTTAENRRTVAITSLVTAAVLLAGGGARLAIVHRRARARDSDVDGDEQRRRQAEAHRARGAWQAFLAVLSSSSALTFAAEGDGGALLWRGDF